MEHVAVLFDRRAQAGAVDSETARDERMPLIGNHNSMASRLCLMSRHLHIGSIFPVLLKRFQPQLPSSQYGSPVQCCLRNQPQTIQRRHSMLLYRRSGQQARLREPSEATAHSQHDLHPSAIVHGLKPSPAGSRTECSTPDGRTVAMVAIPIGANSSRP